MTPAEEIDITLYLIRQYAEHPTLSEEQRAAMAHLLDDTFAKARKIVDAAEAADGPPDSAVGIERRGL